MSATHDILLPFSCCCFALVHSHSVCICINVHVFATIYHSPRRFLGFYYLIHYRHTGTCWQKYDRYLLWVVWVVFLFFFFSPQISESAGVALSISAICYSKLSSFLIYHYKIKLQFSSFNIIILSINSNLIQSSYCLSPIQFYWILVNSMICLPTFSSSLFTFY